VGKEIVLGHGGKVSVGKEIVLGLKTRGQVGKSEYFNFGRSFSVSTLAA